MVNRRIRAGSDHFPSHCRGAALLPEPNSHGRSYTDGQAFGQVQDSLSFIVSSYTDIAAWRAVVERFAGFQSALELPYIQAVTKAGIRHADGMVGA